MWLFLLIGLVFPNFALGLDTDTPIPDDQIPIGLVRINIRYDDGKRAMVSGSIAGVSNDSGHLVGTQIITAGHLVPAPFEIESITRADGTTIPNDLVDGMRIATYGDVLTFHLARAVPTDIELPKETPITPTHSTFGAKYQVLTEPLQSFGFGSSGPERKAGKARGMYVNHTSRQNEDYTSNRDSTSRINPGDSGGPLLQKDGKIFILRGVASAFPLGAGVLDHNIWCRVDTKYHAGWLAHSSGYEPVGTLLYKTPTELRDPETPNVVSRVVRDGQSRCGPPLEALSGSK